MTDFKSYKIKESQVNPKSRNDLKLAFTEPAEVYRSHELLPLRKNHNQPKSES